MNIDIEKVKDTLMETITSKVSNEKSKRNSRLVYQALEQQQAEIEQLKNDNEWKRILYSDPQKSGAIARELGVRLSDNPIDRRTGANNHQHWVNGWNGVKK